ncbi:MAG TPA: hypothetical protein VHN79_12705 [Lacunisphaera sp.]|nr:hypothetical protein [Lacunisphaera sp.]
MKTSFASSVLGIALWGITSVLVAAQRSNHAPEPDSPTKTEAPVSPGSGHFKRMDLDADGRISLAEFTAGRDTAPAATGTQPGGVASAGSPTTAAPPNDILSSAAAAEGRSPEVFRNLDVNHDNHLSRAELDALYGNAHNLSQP